MRHNKIVKAVISILIGMILSFLIYSIYFWVNTQNYNIKTPSDYELILIDADSSVEQRFISQSNYLKELGFFMINTDETNIHNFFIKIFNENGDEILSREYSTGIIRTGEMNYLELNQPLVNGEIYTLKLVDSTEKDANLYSMVVIPKRNLPFTRELLINNEQQYMSMALSYQFLAIPDRQSIIVMALFVCIICLFITEIVQSKAGLYLRNQVRTKVSVKSSAFHKSRI